MLAIRPLKNSDFFRVVDMLKKAGAKSGNRLSSMIVAGSGTDSGEAREDAVAEVGMTVLNELYEVLSEEVTAWFADLCGMTPDKFLELPLNASMDVMEWLVNDQENARFFSRAWQLFSKTKGFVSKLKKG